MCIPGFVFEYSKKFRRNWRLKVHYMAMSCSRSSPLRYVCGQTIDPTAMICTFLESQTDLDVHPRKRSALFGQNRRNWRRRSTPKTMKFAHVARRDEVRVFWYVMHYSFLLVLRFREIGQNWRTKLQNFAFVSVCVQTLERSIASRLRLHQSQHNYGSYIFGKPK